MPDEIPQFIGEYEDVPVDPKGRLIVPLAIRKELPLGVNSFVVARWFDGCLAGFDPGVWHRVLQQLLALDGGQRQARQLRRSVAGGAMEAKIDRQGRLLIPRKLLDRANIMERATVSGAIDHVEIWNPARYVEYMNETDQRLEEIVETYGLR
ncbi:MAG: cell division/cell wall cluster transcriptional repressor MraZ [Gemmatimonadetes bacterium]|nr:cell division/cell wall cluster transcriptional repressor MraZ [Gemmatimonadota bacterium]|tara:strand:+ start:2399 stop:2854 length:456 start_codon:yes stop_codon:yes gene_type:complete